MPEQLFEIPSPLPDQPAVSAEVVGQLNPQAGDMRHLDEVLWMDDKAIEAVGIKRVHSGEFWVPVHIPGRPLMPGVLMLEAAAQLCSIMFRTKVDETKFLGFTRLDNVVFRGQVVPGDDLYLLAQEQSLKPRRIISHCQGVVKDTIVFEATVTGMVI